LHVFTVLRESQGGLRVKAAGIIGAIIGGIAGALVWGAIAKYANLEVGYVAWGVGLAVGFLSYALGGRGIANGVLCAIVALLGIFGGKTVAMKWTATPDDILSELSKDETFKEIPEAEKQKMAATFADSVTWADAARFATEELDLIDIIFAILGIGTAFKLGGAPKEEEQMGPMPMSPLAGSAPPEPGSPVTPPTSVDEPPPPNTDA
jgi:hypothetical protein